MICIRIALPGKENEDMEKGRLDLLGVKTPTDVDEDGRLPDTHRGAAPESSSGRWRDRNNREAHS